MTVGMCSCYLQNVVMCQTKFGHVYLSGAAQQRKLRPCPRFCESEGLDVPLGLAALMDDTVVREGAWTLLGGTAWMSAVPMVCRTSTTQ